MVRFHNNILGDNASSHSLNLQLLNFSRTANLTPLQVLIYNLLFIVYWDKRGFIHNWKFKISLVITGNHFEVKSNFIKYSVIVNSLLSFSMYSEIHSLHNRRYVLVFFWQALARVKWAKSATHKWEKAWGQ